MQTLINFFNSPIGHLYILLGVICLILYHLGY